MTVVHMSDKGQIVVPKEIRDAHGFTAGSAFAVLAGKSGAVTFKPVNGQPKKDLVDHIIGLKGLDLQIPERKHVGPPRV